MRSLGRVLSGIAIPLWVLQGCGLYVPDKNPLISGTVDRKGDGSAQASYEDLIVRHVNCELAGGMLHSAKEWDSPWLLSDTTGTTITLTITALQQSGLNTGVSITRSFLNGIKVLPTQDGGNVVTPQSFSLGIGATGAANASRTETISWTERNSDFLTYAKTHDVEDCSSFQKGVMIDSDLKIAEFIDDNLKIARRNNLTVASSVPKEFQKAFGTDIAKVALYNTFTEDLNFVGAFGGNINPTWKLISFTANTPGNLLSVQNTYTNDLVITVGQLQKGVYPYQLGGNGQTQHQTRVNANAIATSIMSQAH